MDKYLMDKYLINKIQVDKNEINPPKKIIQEMKLQLSKRNQQIIELAINNLR